MAAAGSVSVEERKTADKLSIGLDSWEKCEGDTTQVLKEGLTAIKDEFFKVAKEKGFKSESQEYNVTENGICLLLIGGQHFVGLVSLSKAGLLGGYFASIRFSRVVGTQQPQPFKLDGFYISIFSSLEFVENGQYVVPGGDEEPELKGTLKLSGSGWVPIEGNSVQLCINAMNGVKDEFFKVAKERGYAPATQEYHPTTTGVCRLLRGGQHFIGLVKLVKPGLLGGYYASIRVSQIKGTRDPQPYVLRGFIVSVKPWFRFVEDGVFSFGNDVNASYALAASGGESKDVMLVKPPIAATISNATSQFVNGQMNYVPIGTSGTPGTIQSAIDGFRAEILKQAGITGDLDTFQIVSASGCNAKWTINLWSYFVKIYIGIDDETNFTKYIYVKYNRSLWGTGSLSLVSVQTFPY